MIRTIRGADARSLVSFGDCAVTGNVTALRNPLGGAEAVLQRGLPRERRRCDPQIPPSRDRAACCWTGCVPVHAVVAGRRLSCPGCPPPADAHPRRAGANCSTARPPRPGRARDVKFG